MGGHSQFSNIKHRKGRQDAKRSKNFGKLIREITVAAKLGQPDPASNPRLRQAIYAARKENLPKDRIDAAIKSASVNVPGENYEEVMYEGYGPEGTTLLVHALTNNRNRTLSTIRYIFNKRNGRLGESGSVTFLYDHLGLIVYKLEGISFDDLFDLGSELDVKNVEEDETDKLGIITCEVKDFGKIRDAFYKKFGEPEVARLAYQPKNPIQISDKNLAEKLDNFVTALEDSDDVQYVEANFTFSDET